MQTTLFIISVVLLINTLFLLFKYYYALRLIKNRRTTNHNSYKNRFILLCPVYHEETNIDYMNNELKCLGTEMETFALFHNANHLGKKATAILTVSDHLRTGKETTPEEREKAFNNMIEIALNTTLTIENN